MPAPVQRHWENFVRFVKYEKAAGGPDPHMRTMEWLARRNSGGSDSAMWTPEMLARRSIGGSDCDMAWAAGLYAGVYNVPTAHMLLEDFGGWEAALQLSTDGIANYLQSHWKGIDFRRERRAVRSPEKLARYMKDYAHFVEAEPWTEWSNYEEAWDAVTAVYSVGRYAALKLLEALRRFVDPMRIPGQSDMRAPGGWSPRACLALLFPLYAEVLKQETPECYYITDKLGSMIAEKLNLSMYETQVLLCDFKQSAVTRRQYPGKSLDSEIGYAGKVYPWWVEENSDLLPRSELLWLARAELFDRRCLGEVRGWTPADRKPLAEVLTSYGYTWSDTAYDFCASRDNLSRPVPWQ